MFPAPEHLAIWIRCTIYPLMVVHRLLVFFPSSAGSSNGHSPVLNLSKSGGLDQGSTGDQSDHSEAHSPPPSIHDEEDNLSDDNVSDVDEREEKEDGEFAFAYLFCLDRFVLSFYLFFVHENIPIVTVFCCLFKFAFAPSSPSSSSPCTPFQFIHTKRFNWIQHTAVPNEPTDYDLPWSAIINNQKPNIRFANAIENLWTKWSGHNVLAARHAVPQEWKKKGTRQSVSVAISRWVCVIRRMA